MTTVKLAVTIALTIVATGALVMLVTLNRWHREYEAILAELAKIRRDAPPLAVVTDDQGNVVQIVRAIPLYDPDDNDLQVGWSAPGATLEPGWTIKYPTIPHEIR